MNSYLKSLRHSVSKADGELLHLGNLQPLLLCLVLRASFHHHLKKRRDAVQAGEHSGTIKAVKRGMDHSVGRMVTLVTHLKSTNNNAKIVETRHNNAKMQKTIKYEKQKAVQPGYERAHSDKGKLLFFIGYTKYRGQ